MSVLVHIFEMSVPSLRKHVVAIRCFKLQIFTNRNGTRQTDGNSYRKQGYIPDLRRAAYPSLKANRYLPCMEEKLSS